MLAITHGMLSSGDARSIPPADRIGVAESIRPIDITVIDGKTIRAQGRTMSLMGFDAPDAESRAQCARERELGARATAQLQTLVGGGGLELRRRADHGVEQSGQADHSGAHSPDFDAHFENAQIPLDNHGNRPVGCSPTKIT